MTQSISGTCESNGAVKVQFLFDRVENRNGNAENADNKHSFFHTQYLIPIHEHTQFI